VCGLAAPSYPYADYHLSHPHLVRARTAVSRAPTSFRRPSALPVGRPPPRGSRSERAPGERCPPPVLRTAVAVKEADKKLPSLRAGSRMGAAGEGPLPASSGRVTRRKRCLRAPIPTEKTSAKRSVACSRTAPTGWLSFAACYFVSTNGDGAKGSRGRLRETMAFPGHLSDRRDPYG
jgi:hypothetical protein